MAHQSFDGSSAVVEEQLYQHTEPGQFRVKFKVSAFGSILKYCINSTSTETMSSGHISDRYLEVFVKGGSTVWHTSTQLLVNC